MKNLVILSVFALAAITHAVVSDFEDLTLDPESYWNGYDYSGGFTSDPASYNNYYDTTYGEYWEGFSYSNRTDVGTVGPDGQYSVITGNAYAGSNYGIVYCGFYGNPTITLISEMQVPGLYVTNVNYTYDAMLNGYGVASAFGENDWLKLYITGKDVGGAETGTVEYVLGMGSDLLDSWAYVDLTGLGSVKTLEFTMDSSDHLIIDNVDYGINTPSYFAIDNVIPEPTTLSLLGLGIIIVRRKRMQFIKTETEG